MTFTQKLSEIITQSNSLVCVGLDQGKFAVNKQIIDVTHDLVSAYKPNTAFYEANGAEGIRELKQTCDYIREQYPNIVLIVDAKRADIGNTNEGYVKFVFDYLGADAVTLHPYLGKEALKIFLDRKEKGSIILCRTSNPGAGEFQDELYEKVAKHVAGDWNYNGNCGLVVGATYPAELEIVRRIVGNMPILIPGIGAQGGDLEKTLRAGLDSNKAGALINSSRGIIFANNPRDEAQKLKDSINVFRKE